MRSRLCQTRYFPKELLLEQKNITPADLLYLMHYILKLILCSPNETKIYFTCLTKWCIDFPKPKQSCLHDSLIKNLGSGHVIIKSAVRCIHLFISFACGETFHRFLVKGEISSDSSTCCLIEHRKEAGWAIQIPDILPQVPVE